MSNSFRFYNSLTRKVDEFVPNEEGKDGGTSYSGRDSLEEVIALFKIERGRELKWQK